MNYIQINKCDVANGTGVRVVFWMAGCHHRCPGCHNKQAQDFNAGHPITEKTVQEVIDSMDKPYISGITFSGGDPLAPENIPHLIALCHAIRLHFGSTKNIWVYTGYTYEGLNKQQKNAIHEYADVLIDGLYIESLRDITLKFRGSSNQRLIDVKQTIEKGHVVNYGS